MKCFTIKGAICTTLAWGSAPKTRTQLLWLHHSSKEKRFWVLVPTNNPFTRSSLWLSQSSKNELSLLQLQQLYQLSKKRMQHHLWAPGKVTIRRAQILSMISHQSKISESGTTMGSVRMAEGVMQTRRLKQQVRKRNLQTCSIMTARKTSPSFPSNAN